MESKPADGDDLASVTERTERDSTYDDALPWSYPLIRSPLRGQEELSGFSTSDKEFSPEQIAKLEQLHEEHVIADTYLDKLIRELGI